MVTLGQNKAFESHKLPFKTDVEDLLGRFQVTESVRFERFSAIWREMEFSSIFTASLSCREKKFFTQLAFSVVYHYLLPPYSFQIRVGALYMLYGIYNTQVVLPRQKIRLALKDWYHIERLLEDAKAFHHADVVYVFKKLMSDKAFHFTAMPKKLTFEANTRIKHNVNEGFRDHKNRMAELCSEEMLAEIANVHSHYERLMKSSMPTSGVTLLELPELLQKSSAEYQQWLSKRSEKSVKNTENYEPDRATLLASIKAKSYNHLGTVKKSRRHRATQLVKTEPETDSSDRKKGPVSLRARTLLLEPEMMQPELTHEWLLSMMEEDKTALKRKFSRRFKWC